MGRLLTTLTLERRDKNGRRLQLAKQPSRSWLKHFMDLLYEPLGYGVNTLAAINDIDAVARTLSTANAGTNNLFIAAPGGAGIVFATTAFADTAQPYTAYNTYRTGEYIGIVVGTNNAAVTPADDALGTRIAHGSSAGQFEYGGQEVVAPVAANPNGTMILRRYFTNNSGGSITVQESGIYAFGVISSTNIYPFCICRDVVSPGVAVADTQILVVTYTTQITV